ncbi:TadE/TadG family type IV pilus assembly protein [Methylobacterium nonmethylotrophicum]|uniref:Pilus assembly protein n=1 Tax=Methylobacterium nonmethylotrophicum TaxID=1141884 RepID=A0A4Z0NVQ6_9HYPH|nr:TadE/TadG family type IV pilus assembly protein [Methylobacterium nonmethylotrophicum]TGE01237.1 pilus assembly protein [Methylobacterium nonmethylotrophicum]
MSEQPASRSPVSRLVSSSDGASAVEFAMIAPIFIALMLHILQCGLLFVAERVLQNATDSASRKILTGQVQSNQVSESQFKSAVCAKLYNIFDCSAVYVDVNAYSSFSGSSYNQPMLTYDSQGNVNNTWSFNPGQDGKVVIVRVIYRWRVFGGPLTYAIPNTANGYHLMMGVAALRVEPYS